MTPEQYAARGHSETEVRAFRTGYDKVVTGDQITVPLADSIEVRSAADDPYAGRSDQDVAAALAARVSGGPYVQPWEMQGFLVNARTEHSAASQVAQGEVTRPGSGPDAHDREWLYQQEWRRVVGRELTAEELAGRPVAGCVACGRLAGMVCDDHARRPGEPIPYPPESTWPSKWPGHVPGAVVQRPGHYPGDISRTVA